MFHIVVIVASAIIFFRIGDTEYNGLGWLFAAISVLVAVLAMSFIGGGFFIAALSQVALFIVLTIYGMYGKRRDRM